LSVALFDAAASSAAFFFASTAFIAATPRAGAGFFRIFTLALQDTTVNIDSVTKRSEQNKGCGTYFTVGSVFTPGPTRSSALIAAPSGRWSVTPLSRMVCRSRLGRGSSGQAAAAFPSGETSSPPLLLW
jgi:hypothetical protein